ncbi:hypothetical protein AAEU31_12665 [Pseudoalteromonas sp. SSMSWG5]|jgi:aminomethyltransferase|uniref:hypothetical protein n=1 Tax=Pseudoalteromonas TaxID=53246 RepID=UPI000783A984|nr:MULTISPECIES: hypothetical protein [Gammaproteobacteria]MCF7500647.1 hypothetical protein [Pseudoalteromonas sp. L1]RZF91875.1 hypothetical protein EXT42_11460 [Pseudoalteromonas sp. CO302Y]RZG07913.1 hypothetical protein EXT40_12250 [Pseudoalteromonas sp. CO133X]UJX26433.1 hypothetical protein L3Q70_04570 [Pseudoalteromonas sp. CF6-2]WOC27210.1 hypothetical protein LY624_04810 [Pseudoalteromonas sp. N1230-9]HCV03735.1 hypothetical protein [Pseudoalteromonas sp.]|tara:strand:+ start:1362 stop:1961 length:600 start_codon:yes stop_codon:yes gene_type:complete
MTFTPIMFARHSQAETPADNVLQANNDTAIMDFSGTEAIPFLTAILGLDINKLTASGLGLRSSLDDDLTSSYAYALYYFNETAFRFVLGKDASVQLQSLINEQQLRYDIDYVMRDDLSALTLSGEQAFDALVDSFKLTPGLRLSDMRSCYGAQSGEVFITAIDNQATQQFQLVARQAELDKWQTHLQQLGFDLALANVA